MLKKYHPGQRRFKTLWCGLVLSTTFFISSCAPTQDKPQIPFKSVTTLGRLSVGTTLPARSAMIAHQNGRNKLGNRKFLVHLLHSELPPVCTNDECGVFGPIANLKGADLYGGGDLKLADQFYGIFSTENEAFRQESQNYGVLIISDQQAKIRAIYQHVDLPDVETILQDSEAIFAQAD